MFYSDLVRRASYSGVSGGGGYRKYRIEITEDCQHRCVYCDSRKVDIGGDPVMELDHFRPHSIYADLKTDPENLVLACRSCNGKKSNDWPAEASPHTHINGAGYIDPFLESRNEYFKVGQDGVVRQLKAPAHYMVMRLGLNRSLLRGLRRRQILSRKLNVLVEGIKAEIDDALVDPTKRTPELLKKFQICTQLYEKVANLLDNPEG